MNVGITISITISVTYYRS